MSNEDEVRELIHRVLVSLAAPLTPSEMGSGWNMESKQAAEKYFFDLAQKLDAGEVLPPTDIVRGLDHWGVTGGCLLEEVARVANALRRMK